MGMQSSIFIWRQEERLDHGVQRRAAGTSDGAERFAREKLASRYQTREQEGRIDRALVREMGALGLIAGDLAESHGGLGLSSETTGLIMENPTEGLVIVQYLADQNPASGLIPARPERSIATASRNG
jgi:alkylation response protein AidB-like acyl-CoA dehydrogenase